MKIVAIFRYMVCVWLMKVVSVYRYRWSVYG